MPVLKFVARYWQEIAMGGVVLAILGAVLYYGNLREQRGIERGRTAAKIEYDKKLSEVKTSQEKLKIEAVESHRRFVEDVNPKKEVEYVTIEKVITKPVYVERDCIDDNGLHVINAAVARSR